MFKKIASIATAIVALGFGAANANVINIANGGGTITCTGSAEPACLAFAFGAPALGAEPTGPGTLIDGSPNTEVAWYYDGQPANEAAEATRLNTLIGLNLFDSSDATKSANNPPLTFSTLAEYVLLKLGNTSVFIKNTSGGMLNVALNLGPSFGLSHYTEFGAVSQVPLPAAAWLMIAGLSGLGFAGRRKAAA